ncbi:MAG: glycine cleavage system protein H [Desulfobacter sp.]|nr:MAG: glycine cleavage system protein H [Desulfobacter sp.]
MRAKKQKTMVKGFQVVENECIWMKAGIVHFRMCDNAYDCGTCPFDKAMQKTIQAAPHTDSQDNCSRWAQNLKNIYKWTNNPCRHVLTGRISAPRDCAMNYECYHCEFDQQLDEEDMALLGPKPSCLKASGYLLADGYYYHMGHTWARFEHGGRVKIGFDDFMVKLFGTLSEIILPPLGAVLKKDQAGLMFSRADQKAAVFSPITGAVLAVNGKAQDDPKIVHEDPYHEGWLCILEPNMPKRNLKGLFYGKDSLEWTDRESQKLLHLIEPEYQALAAMGGEPVDDVYGSFPQIGWNALARTFLRTEKR